MCLKEKCSIAFNILLKFYYKEVFIECGGDRSLKVSESVLGGKFGIYEVKMGTNEMCMLMFKKLKGWRKEFEGNPVELVGFGGVF